MVAIASLGTSAVMVLPAPIIAPAPMDTGATSAVFDPIDARSPISVLNLSKAIIITGDGASANIGTSADCCVANIG